MKNKLKIMTVTGAVLLGCGASVQALPIVNGNISFGGTSKVNPSDLATATKFTTITSTVDAGTQSGSYSPLTGGEVATFATPFTFAVGPVNVTLWQVVVGGTTYKFTANAVTSVFQNSGFLNISGTGTASITGDTSAVGTWTITDTGSSPTFTFGASTTVPTVPDGGTTVAMLGMALGCFGLFVRKLKTA